MTAKWMEELRPGDPVLVVRQSLGRRDHHTDDPSHGVADVGIVDRTTKTLVIVSTAYSFERRFRKQDGLKVGGTPFPYLRRDTPENRQIFGVDPRSRSYL
jgi:hypothetical protein